MSSIHFIGGEKGGVGKSVVARILAQYFIDNQIPFTAFDSDKSHGALLRYYGDFTTPIVVDDYASLDTVIETLAQAPEQRVLIDLAAQTYNQLWKWFDDSGVAELMQELDLELYYWHVMDAGSDSQRLLEQLLQEKAPQVKLVIVLNEVRGEQFELLLQSGLLTQAHNSGAQVIRLHKLADSTMQKIDANSASYWAAIHASGAHALGLLERQRLKIWLKRFYSELDRLKLGVSSE